MSKNDCEVIVKEDLMLAILKNAVSKHGSQSQFAKDHGVNRSFLNEVLSGKKPVGDKLASVLGFRRETVYVAREITGQDH